MDPDAEELVLIYVAKTLKESLRLEVVLKAAGLDYFVEPDTYKGGVIFASERVGAFFYVAPEDESAARATLEQSGFRPSGAGPRPASS